MCRHASCSPQAVSSVRAAMKAAEAFAAATLRAGSGQGDAAQPAMLADVKADAKALQLSRLVGACCMLLSKHAHTARARCLQRMREMPLHLSPVCLQHFVICTKDIICGWCGATSRPSKRV